MTGNCALEAATSIGGASYEISEPGFKNCMFIARNQPCPAQVAAGRIVSGQCLLTNLDAQPEIE